ncbi:DNA-protecting protein DprA [Candidatus Kaiserbacteria bacterium]|nr:MAG: DNA-protecting protein DprA [Candidatus Kaiserbacteria bacterium]
MTYPIRQLPAEDFPQQLKEIADPPKQLFLRGTLPSPATKILSVVGSRKCTSYGRDVVDYLLGGLKGHDISIVSGLALGIDACAHNAALKASLHTTAVPGSGLEDSVLYPRSNTDLAAEILETGGALLSEFPATQRAAVWTFPQRNRIVAGLSHAVLIIEAAERSGTLITARLAVDYNRDLLVVPASIFAASSFGAHQFLKLGATPVTTPDDILQALGFSPESTEGNSSNLSLLEKEVRSILKKPTDRDELIDQISCSMSKANTILSKLELDGVVIEKLGKLQWVK